MNNKLFPLLFLNNNIIRTGCTSVPMASIEDDNRKKEFTAPQYGSSGLYIYRNSNFGGALKKDIYIDGNLIGMLVGGAGLELV